jgi:hypothetical protein
VAHKYLDIYKELIDKEKQKSSILIKSSAHHPKDKSARSDKSHKNNKGKSQFKQDMSKSFDIPELP